LPHEHHYFDFPADDDAFLHTTNVKDIGDIVIRICVFIPDEREGLPDIFPQMPIGIVHERSKKGIGHQVKSVIHGA
jgi:hypothetical protein